MRATLSIVLLLGLLAWFKFGNPQQDIRYEVKVGNPVTETPGTRTLYEYHVKSVVRLLGADLYRPDGYFTATAFPLLKSTGSAAVAAMEAQKEPVGIRIRVSSAVVDALDLKPQFSFWEEYGRWFLLVMVLGAFFLRK